MATHRASARGNRVASERQGLLIESWAASTAVTPPLLREGRWHGSSAEALSCRRHKATMPELSGTLGKVHKTMADRDPKTLIRKAQGQTAVWQIL